MKVVALLEYAGYPHDLLLQRLVCGYLVLYPVAFLDITEGGNEVIVIRVVVEAVERRDILESFH